MTTETDKRGTAGMIWGLQRRLLIMLLLPLSLVGLVSVYFHYQNAGTAALQQDKQLQQLVPLLADSVVVAQPRDDPSDIEPPGIALLLAPPVEEFLKARQGYAAYGIFDTQGRLLSGQDWLPRVRPATADAEFRSVVEEGTTYRVIAQRSRSAAGPIIVMLADGSDAQQRWLATVAERVLLPNLVLMVVGGLAMTWAVSRALRPLTQLRRAVERRSPRDLSPISVDGVPDEVQPLVDSLNRLFAMVNAQSEGQRRFIADAAHQLRTPLAALQAQVEAWAQSARHIADEQSIPIKAEQVKRLRDASRRTSQLASQLLALSRADAISTQSQPMDTVDLKDVCENVLSMFLDIASAKGIDLGLEASAVQVPGHTWLLRELLINLLDNALKYTPEGGRVTLRCNAGELTGSGWVEIEDDGPGIPPCEHGRVIERFYRLPGSTTEGNGLGLAIASEIARAHHSQLELDTGQGGFGLCVRVVFPPTTHLFAESDAPGKSPSEPTHL